MELVAHDLSKVLPPGRTSGRFPNDAVRFRKGESKQIKVDLTQLLWAEETSSVWPSNHFFGSVQKGKYWLNFKMAINKEAVACNRVEAGVE